jgi:hypothetical protein
MDVAKVDRRMLHMLQVFQRHIASVCSKCFQTYVATVCSKMFHLFQPSVAASIFMLQLFLHIAYVYTYMLQVYVLDVSSILDVCCI